MIKYLVVYLVIGIIVSIVEGAMSLYDLKKYELTIYDVWPSMSQLNQTQIVLVGILASIDLAIVWPVQVYVWIKRIVSHFMDQETEGDLA